MNKSAKSKQSEEVSRSPVSSRAPLNVTSISKGAPRSPSPAIKQTVQAKARPAPQNSRIQTGGGKAPSVIPKFSVTKPQGIHLTGRTRKNEPNLVVKLNSKSKQKKNRKKASRVGMNPYLECLLDPFNAPSARIVDDQCYPSAVFKIIRRVSMTANNNGVVGVMFGFYTTAPTQDAPFGNCGSLIPLRVLPDESLFYYDWIVGQMTNAGSTSAALFTGQPDQLDKIQLVQWDSKDEGVPSLFTNVRLVSAGLSCHFNGTPLDAKGRICAVSVPFESFISEYSNSAGLGVDDLLTLPGAISCPVNQLKGAISLYKPADYTSFNYVGVRDMTLYEYTDTSNHMIESVSYARPGVLFLVLDGVEPGASVTFTYVGHYEGLPRTSTLNLVDAEISPNDPLELAHSMNVIQRTPNTFGDAGAAINTARGGGDSSIAIPHTSEQPKQGTTIEKVINGIGTVGNVVSKVAPLAMELLAMI